MNRRDTLLDVDRAGGHASDLELSLDEGGENVDERGLRVRHLDAREPQPELPGAVDRLDVDVPP